MKRHRAAISALAASVRSFHLRERPFRISHGSTNSTRQPHAARDVIETGALNQVISVDESRRTCFVQPNVPMDALVKETLKFGLVPPVVMEFPGITVGGGYAGTSGESSSFKHGFFDCTIRSVEMVLGNGDVVVARRDNEYADLFHGAAGACGSLGIATCIELELVKAEPFVETTYHAVQSISEARDMINSACQDPDLEYVDGILFSQDRGAVITGRLVREQQATCEEEMTRFSRPQDPWFYQHVEAKVDDILASTNYDEDAKRKGESFAVRREPIKETIDITEYLFRYDRGGFWVGDSAFKYTMVPNTKLTRWFLDDFLHTRMLYRALHASGQARQYMVQDLALPNDTVEEFVDFTADRFGIWPLWLCPLRPSPAPTLHPHDCRVDSTGSRSGPREEKSIDMMLNVGLWGEPQGHGALEFETFVAGERELEQKLLELGGMKWGYANHYYPEEEFWSMFDKEWYDSLREKYHAKHLPTMYDKVSVDLDRERREMRSSWSRWALSIWPIGGVWALWKAIKSKDYLLHRQAKQP